MKDSLELLFHCEAVVETSLQADVKLHDNDDKKIMYIKLLKTMKDNQ